MTTLSIAPGNYNTREPVGSCPAAQTYETKAACRTTAVSARQNGYGSYLVRWRWSPDDTIRRVGYDDRLRWAQLYQLAAYPKSSVAVQWLRAAYRRENPCRSSRGHYRQRWPQQFTLDDRFLPIRQHFWRYSCESVRKVVARSVIVSYDLSVCVCVCARVITRYNVFVDFRVENDNVVEGSCYCDYA